MGDGKVFALYQAIIHFKSNLTIMESIFLNNNLKLSFEKLPQSIRLIISKNDEELVCRKEKLKNLFAFLETDKEHLFKGRLQLFKTNDKIDIQVRNESINSISRESFQQALTKMK